MRRDILEALVAARAAGAAAVLVTPLDGGVQRLLTTAEFTALEVSEPELARACSDALRTDRAVLLARVAADWLLTPMNPPLRLVVVGAVHIAEALCRIARIGGYSVTVVDPRSSFLRPELFPEVQLIGDWPQQAFASIQPDARTAVVLLTHDPKIDDPALQAVLPGAAFYIGALGSTRTHARRLARLAEAGVPADQLARIHGPAGLAIAARTPAEIAISILAQMTQQLRGATP
ncbi:MAG: XdhC family protein [Pseudomonadota bacterium]